MAAGVDPSWVRLTGPWRHFDVRANGIRFHAVEVTPADPDRPLVLLLHGLGEMWWAWRHQLVHLACDTHRVVAIDLRGYGDSDKPPRGYDGWTLAGDVYGLIRALGHRKATLVGHADGGLGAWTCAALHSAAVSSIAVISAPHPRALRSEAIRDSQVRSRFGKQLLGNQIPRLAERALIKDDGAMVAEVLAARSGAAWQATDDFATAVQTYRTAIQIPSVAHCALEYRRWAFRSQFRPDGRRFLADMNTQLSIPVLAVRGTDDNYMGHRVIAEGAKYAEKFDFHTIHGSGHYVHEEVAEEVTSLLDRFLHSS